MTEGGGFPPGGSLLLLPLTDAQFESALEAHHLRVPTFLLPEDSEPGYLGLLRMRQGGMLTHWTEIRGVDRKAESGAGVLVRVGPLRRFPRPIEWRERREIYRPVRVDVEALKRAEALDELVGTEAGAAQRAITQAIDFIEIEQPKLDFARVNRKHLLDRAAGFAAKNPVAAIAQIDAAVTEALRDIVSSYYGESREEDEGRDGWFGHEKFEPSVEAYFELLREAEDNDLAPLLSRVERYLVVRGRASGLASPSQPVQVIDLIAVAQSVFDAATGD
jgi:hypothetical protein